jgi:hypothetical protein
VSADERPGGGVEDRRLRSSRRGRVAVVVVLPQPWAHAFYVVKGLTAVAAVVLAGVHMADTWANIPTLAQRLRYFFLLLTVVVIAGGSTAQFQEDAPVHGRNVGGFLIAATACVAMVVSIRQDRRR